MTLRKLHLLHFPRLKDACFCFVFSFLFKCQWIVIEEFTKTVNDQDKTKTNWNLDGFYLQSLPSVVPSQNMFVYPCVFVSQSLTVPSQNWSPVQTRLVFVWLLKTTIGANANCNSLDGVILALLHERVDFDVVWVIFRLRVMFRTLFTRFDIKKWRLINTYVSFANDYSRFKVSCHSHSIMKCLVFST